MPAAREASCAGRVPDLTTIEFDIVERLVRTAGRIVSRDGLTAALYRRKAGPFDRAIDVHFSSLRKKLGAHGGLIRTVRGVGYPFQPGGDAAMVKLKGRATSA